MLLLLKFNGSSTTMSKLEKIENSLMLEENNTYPVLQFCKGNSSHRRETPLIFQKCRYIFSKIFGKCSTSKIFPHS